MSLEWLGVCVWWHIKAHRLLRAMEFAFFCEILLFLQNFPEVEKWPVISMVVGLMT